MNKYSLYGTVLISNDNTLKDFATCVYDNISKEEIREDRKDVILELAENALEDDIRRTTINYEELLLKYKTEFGDLFYQMWNQGYNIPTPEFSGIKARSFFEDLVYFYIAVHFDELEENKAKVA